MSFRKGYTSNNSTVLIRGGKAYFDLLLQLIEQAKHTIHLQVYIFDADETGRMVADALMAAARRQVAVYLLADGYASQHLPSHFIHALRQAGIQFRHFEPLLKSRKFYFGRRLHHKVFVADATDALVGGINISNHYNDMTGRPAWVDFAIHVNGETAQGLQQVCEELWMKPPRKLLSRRMPQPVADQEAQGPYSMVRIRRNDWVDGKNEVSRSYLELFKQAHSHITIIASYFLPARIFRKHLAMAATRGVDITVILTSRSDVKLAKYAERFLYRWLFKNNITVYEYRDYIVHAKVAVRDGRQVTIGSYNINSISAYTSVELNLDVKDHRFAHTVEERLQTIARDNCTLITEDTYNLHTNRFQRFLQRSAYNLIRILFFLFTFYFKQEKTGSR